MDVKRILKVFTYVNDEGRQKVNVKFAGLLAAFLLAGAALAVFALSQSGGTAPPTDNQSATKTEYVGLTPIEAAVYDADPVLVEQRMAQWEEAHPDAQIISKQPHYDDQGRMTGYDVTYRDPA